MSSGVLQQGSAGYFLAFCWHFCWYFWSRFLFRFQPVGLLVMVMMVMVVVVKSGCVAYVGGVRVGASVCVLTSHRTTPTHSAQTT